MQHFAAIAASAKLLFSLLNDRPSPCISVVRSGMGFQQLKNISISRCKLYIRRLLSRFFNLLRRA